MAINTTELNKVVREMQNASLEKHKVANNFNQKAADLIRQGADDRMRTRGWPVGTRPPEKVETKKGML